MAEAEAVQTTFAGRPVYPRGGVGDPRTLYAGYSDGRQIRVAYFSAAVTREMDGWPLQDPPFEIVPLATQDVITTDDLVDLWVREGALGEAEARRRIDEVLLIAVGTAGRPIGVSTRFLMHSPLLDLSVWNVRVFVAASARQSAAATALSVAARDHQVQIVLIGESPNGDHVRVYYFAGATVPLRA